MTEKSIKEMHEIIKKFNEKTAIPSVVLTAERGENIAVTDSKFGGLPYLPKDYPYPPNVQKRAAKTIGTAKLCTVAKIGAFSQRGDIAVLRFA